MKKIYKILELNNLALAKAKSFPGLRSVGDDATSYKGNQLHYVIALSRRP